MEKYQIVISNIGTVWTGENGFTARTEYGQYVALSEEAYGRMAGENVTLFQNREPLFEHAGYLHAHDE